MERKKPSLIVRVLKIIAGVALIMLGLYFCVVAVLCTMVDGAHILGYTLLPALALAAFLLAWLLLRRRRRIAQGEKNGAQQKSK